MQNDRYFLLSKDTGQGAYLIGLLTRTAKGEYTFEYMINKPEFPEWFMKIPGMDDLNKVYNTDEVKKLIIHRVTPREGTFLASILMKEHNVSVYDEWDLLELQMSIHNKYKPDIFPLSDSHQIFYFYEDIPKKVNRYD